MTPAEKAFYKLLAHLTSEGKVTGDAGERIIAAFEAAMETKETQCSTSPAATPSNS